MSSGNINEKAFDLQETLDRCPPGTAPAEAKLRLAGGKRMLKRLLPHHWPLWLQLSVPVALVMILSIGLVAFLNDFNFQKSDSALTEQRYLVLGKDARQVVEAGLNAGLDPALNQGLPLLFDQLRERTPGLLLVAMTGPDGKAVLSSGDRLADLPLVPAGAAKDDGVGWRRQTAGILFIGLPVRNSFGVGVGALVLGYERDSAELAARAMRAKLLRSWLLVSLAIALLTPLLFWLLTRRMSRELAEAAHAVERALDEQAPQLPPLPASGQELAEDLDRIIAVSREVAGQLSELERERQR
jgi:hypothetical protein